MMIPSIAVAVLSLTSTILQLHTPDELHQCQPATFTWTPTTPPYVLSVTLSDLFPSFDIALVDADRWINAGETVIVIPEASTATWIVDLPEGLNVTTHVKDGQGNVASGWPRVIGPGSNHCMMV